MPGGRGSARTAGGRRAGRDRGPGSWGPSLSREARRRALAGRRDRGYVRRPRRADMSSPISRAALCLICVAGLLGPRAKLARADGRATDAYLDQTRERWERAARQIWDMPELGLKETRSSAALIEILQKEGFQV